jgi:hypothetical protein
MRCEVSTVLWVITSSRLVVIANVSEVHIASIIMVNGVITKKTTIHRSVVVQCEIFKSCLKQTCCKN